jgi:hypothetical protein
MTTSVLVHARTSPEDFAPSIRILDVGKDKVFSLWIEKHGESSICLSHGQMIGLRDVLTKAIAESPLKCSVAQCEEEGESTCENCGKRFCSDHGQKGGDREGGTNPNGSSYGAYAVPASCVACR